MKSWIREISNMTLFEVLQNANNAIARAEAEEQRDSDRETQNSEAEELLDFQTALAIAAEASNIQDQMERLVADSMAFTGSWSGYEDLAQLVWYRSIVPGDLGHAFVRTTSCAT